MSEMRELIDTELDAVCGGHHGHHGHRPGASRAPGESGESGLFSFGNFGNIGNIVNFGNIVIEQTIALQIGVAVGGVGGNASVTNLLGSQTNLSSIAFLAA
jgi:hypothetical protein